MSCIAKPRVHVCEDLTTPKKHRNNMGSVEYVTVSIAQAYYRTNSVLTC